MIKLFAQLEHRIGEPNCSPLVSKSDAQVKLSVASKDCNG